MDKNKPSQEELLKAVADVLDEAIATYDQLAKGEGIANAVVMDQFMGAGPGIIGEPMKEGHTEASALGSGEVEKGKPVEKEEDSKEKEKEDKEKDKDKDSDEKLMDTYKSLVVKMESRGLMQKMDKEKKEKKIQKSESVESDLRKSVDERFEVLTKALNEVSETVKKIAATPAPRKGLAGYQPLKKTEAESQTLKKSEVVDRLVDLKKSGDARVDTALINRVETGRLLQNDVNRIKALGIFE